MVFSLYFVMKEAIITRVVDHPGILPSVSYSSWYRAGDSAYVRSVHYSFSPYSVLLIYLGREGYQPESPGPSLRVCLASQDAAVTDHAAVATRLVAGRVVGPGQ